MARRRLLGHRGLEEAGKLRRRQLGHRGAIGGVDRIEQPVHTIAEQRRDVVEPGKAEECELVADLGLDPLAPVLVEVVPLVDRHHQSPPRLVDESADMAVLVRDVLPGIQDQDGHVAVLDRLQGLDHRKLLDRLEDLAATPQPGGVDQGVAPAAALEGHGDRVARGARLVEGNHPLLAEQGVDQRGLADVRPADHRHPRTRLLVRLGRGLGKTG